MLHFMIWLIFLLEFTIGNAIFVTEISRHGARAPTKLYPFDIAFWDPNLLGELTPTGMRQHYLIGHEFRRRYTQVTPLLSEIYNSSEIYVQATSSDRTIMSAWSQMLGLYPLGTGPNVTLLNTAPPMNISAYTASIQNALGKAALTNSMQVIPINVIQGPKDHVLHGYDSDSCARISQISATLKNSTVYLNNQQYWANGILKTISEVLGVKISTISSASNIHTALECDLYNGNPWKTGMNETLFEQLAQIHGFSKFYVPFSDAEARNLSCSAFFQELIGNIKQAFNGGDLKFAYYSAHDTTLAAFLSCLDLAQDYNPPFASTLVFEAYQNATVGLIYNDVLTEIPSCSNIYCPVDEFYEILNSAYVPDLETACKLQ
ncbi:unnamed protein product [Blepharisma stoltei]|uniref:Acid phosphatase n=1 Tax=Blepharisma stoltei TaxID=1481888 RepID=A0AAU9KDK6_9CILI|nr:unnamed protein product [Blepharisma stoltei]